LTACNEENFEPNAAEVALNGTTTSDLDDYIVTTSLVTLPAYNIFGADPTLSALCHVTAMHQ
jgi:hypothetical protein